VATRFADEFFTVVYPDISAARQCPVEQRAEIIPVYRERVNLHPAPPALGGLRGIACRTCKSQSNPSASGPVTVTCLPNASFASSHPRSYPAFVSEEQREVLCCPSPSSHCRCCSGQPQT